MEKAIVEHTRLKGANHEIRELRMQLEHAGVMERSLTAQVIEARKETEEAKAQLRKARNEFADLKQRLHDAIVLNAQMHGYVKRVQEDDVVREDLIRTGDPDGHTTLTPKRRPTFFPDPEMTARPSTVDEPHRSYGLLRDREREKPKHWIAYGE